MTHPQSPAWTRAARTPVGIAALALIALVVIVALIGPLVWGDAAGRIDVDALNETATWHHPLGTDALGRDILLRVLVATRLSLELALLATAIGFALGVVLGTARILFGTYVGRISDTVVNVANAFPSLLMILFFAAVFGVTTSGAVFALALSSAPTFARLTRTLTASVERQDYVSAARISGAGRIKILVRHILPNVAEPMILNATMSAGSALLTFGGLSFLGIGIQPPSYDFGRLLNDGMAQFYTNPLAVLGPALAVVVAGLGFSLLGEAATYSVSGRSTDVAVDRAPVTSAVPVDSAGAVAPYAPGSVLSVDDLEVSFGRGGGALTPVRGVSLRMNKGDKVGVVGESGSGKSLTALAVAQLIEEPGRVMAGRLEFQGQDLGSMDERDRRTLLGTSLSVVFQNTMSSFNPIRRLGWQLADGARHHHHLGREEAFGRAKDRLTTVGIPDAHRKAHQYPHQFSGGMRQRAMIAMGVMGTPSLIIADEPTTALDATTQSRVLRLLKGIVDDDRASLLLISHDITVIKNSCERVLVMYAGRVVEELPTTGIERGARHPYTLALLSAVPTLDTDRDEPLTVIPGRAPRPGEVTAGCPFAARCGSATGRCHSEEPPLLPLTEGHRAACWHPAPGDGTTYPPRSEEQPMHGGPVTTADAGRGVSGE
ncbi:dipeptide/oligopeptide/nickel ABC transporter permease/ATP-binding protein [Streptomyces sp. 150FB]|uniref:dipeptide/oligopeptide/nickel ABC transporter permease/ATP-binding protein n=1 Tax=Streptomyces sp. 150FB TaxID=1576605 RepID=UPI0007C6889E|nr:dipeptide/oligopeptide/nickel ABC transporter permease/ATP-binding protein [Streptomyces sp. 150FB]